MRRTFLLLFSAFSFVVAHGQRRDSFSVYFPFNGQELTDEAQAFIDSLSFNDVIHESQTVRIIGYTDYVGGVGYNDVLSKARANAVATYLENNGIKRKNIVVCIGKGKIPFNGASGNDGNAPDRRVDVVLTTVKRTIHTPPVPSHIPAKEIRATDLAHAHTGEIAALDKIYFYAGRHTVREGSQADLEQLLHMLQDRKTLRVRIEGHVCCVNGPDAMDDDNNEVKLSRNRAKAIYSYLVENGISAQRLEYAGFGRSRPIVPIELTEDDANLNRRVEVRSLANRLLLTITYCITPRQ